MTAKLMSHHAEPGSVTSLYGKTCSKSRQKESDECYGCGIYSEVLQATRGLTCHFSPAMEVPATLLSLQEEDNSPDETDLPCTCQRADTAHKNVIFSPNAMCCFSDGAGSDPTYRPPNALLHGLLQDLCFFFKMVRVGRDL